MSAQRKPVFLLAAEGKSKDELKTAARQALQKYQEAAAAKPEPQTGN
jgi:hypothetical protein